MDGDVRNFQAVNRSNVLASAFATFSIDSSEMSLCGQVEKPHEADVVRRAACEYMGTSRTGLLRKFRHHPIFRASQMKRKSAWYYQSVAHQWSCPISTPGQRMHRQCMQDAVT